MNIHRVNGSYISEADRLKARFYSLIGYVIGWGNIIGGLAFGWFVIASEQGATFSEYPVPLAMLILGGFSLWLGKTTIQGRVKEHLYAINYVSIPLILFYFIDEVAVSIWAVVFLYLMVALILQSFLLVSYVLAVSLAVLISLVVLVPEELMVVIGTDHHLFRLALMILAAGLAYWGLKSMNKREKMLFHYMDQAEEMAYQDPFLKIPNRMDFNLYIDYMLKEKHFIVGKIEINHFQSVYDVLGHQKSDELLNLVKVRLEDKLTGHSYLAKAEGSTFLIAVENSFANEEVVSYFQDILQVLSAPYELKNHNYMLTFSIGTSCSKTDGQTSDELMRHAQFALDKAKDSGINRWVYCSEEIKRDSMNQVRISEALYQADLEKEFCVVYQPQVQLETNRMVGVEALVRWQHPEIGTISPGVFIEIAEKNGFIVPLGNWILERACRQVQELTGVSEEPLKLAVNVSFIQIQQEHFVEETLAILKKTGFPPENLEIELTERSLFENRMEDLQKIEELRSHGIRIAIDDFGTGYSSFGILAKVKVDKIKVPREFIDRVDSNQNSQRIVETITSMAERFELTCLAEGIEREEESTFLRQLICQEVQGYYYAKPVEIHQIKQWNKPKEEFSIELQ